MNIKIRKMRAIKLLIISLLTNLNIFGQIIDSKNSLNYLKVEIPTCEKSTNCSGKFYENNHYMIGNDTIIHNKTYSKIIVSTIRNNDTISDLYIGGYIREDENHKMIYSLLTYISDSTEVLLYDFSIKKDSLFTSTYKIVYHIPDGNDTVTELFFSSKVLEIDSVNYYGVKRLCIKFDSYTMNWVGDIPTQDTIEWIEGIGSKQGLIDYRYGGNLLCFKQDAKIAYLNNYGFDCSYSGPLVGIQSKEMVNLNVYPNPAKNVVNIQSDKLINNVILFKITGEILGQYKPKNSQYQIDLSNIGKGLYILKIDNTFKKIIIE